MKLSGELDYRIRYDVEHNLFHVKNVFNDEYITPTFVEYVQKLEKENAELKNRDCWKSCEYANPKAELIGQHIKDVQNLTKAKELLKWWVNHCGNHDLHYAKRTEQFLKEYSDNLSLKDEELMCLETEFNTYKSEAKEIIRKLIDYPRIYGQVSGRYKHECDLAEQFLKDSEVKK